MASRFTEIDWNEVDEMIIAGCPGTEIAGHYGLHPNTLYNRAAAEHGCVYSEYAHNKKSTGDARIRMKQYKEAVENGNTQLLIKLGEYRLGQGKDLNDNIPTADFKAKISSVKGLHDDDVLQPEASNVAEGSNSEN